MFEKQLIIPEEYRGKRIDQALALLLTEFSRTQITDWLNQHWIVVNQAYWLPKQKVQGGETVDIRVTFPEKTIDQAEPIRLSIIHEDEAILVINKPAGLVVHPGAGNESGTLLNALLHHNNALRQLPRAGIIHRLDKDTSGLLLIAKTLPAHTALVHDLQERQISREYEAVVQGVLTGGGIIDAPIGRDPKQRLKMAVHEQGKSAVTRYYVLERFRGHTHIRVVLETGRTHQIRVHMASQNHPIIGDPLYGGRQKIPKGASLELINLLQHFKRQALHAVKLEFIHPVSHHPLKCEAPLPKDLLQLLCILREDHLHDR